MLPAVIAFAMPYIEPIIVSVIVDRLVKFGKDTDWTKVKLDCNAKVRAILPDFIFSDDGEDAVVLFVDRRISAFAVALKDVTQQKALVNLILNGNFKSAFELVTRLAGIAP